MKPGPLCGKKSATNKVNIQMLFEFALFSLVYLTKDNSAIHWNWNLNPNSIEGLCYDMKQYNQYTNLLKQLKI